MHSIFCNINNEIEISRMGNCAKISEKRLSQIGSVDCYKDKRSA